MSQDLITSKTANSGDEISFRLEDGHLNDILIAVEGGVGTSKITAKYKAKDKQAVYQTQGLKLAYVQSIADKKGGHNIETTGVIQSIIKGLDEIITEDGTAIEDSLPADVVTYGTRNFDTNILLPLGSVFFNESSLDISLDINFTGGGTKKVKVYRVSRNNANHHLIRYEVSKEVKATYPQSTGVYAFSTENNHNLDVEFHIRDWFDTVTPDYHGLHQMALIQGQYELVPKGSVAVQVYQPPTEIPEQVYISMQGADTDKIELLNVQLYLDLEEIRKNQTDQEAKKRNRWNEFQRKSGEYAQALAEIIS